MTAVKSPKPRFFPTPDRFRTWLEQHHADAGELWVGFYKTGSGRRSLTWPQSVDQGLCFGWDEQRRAAAFDAAQTRRFRANAKAWAYFKAEAPWYQRVATYFLTSAKKEETRDRRLTHLIAASAAGTRIGLLGRPDLPRQEGVTRSVSRRPTRTRRGRAIR